jgi:hypothetical protein
MNESKLVNDLVAQDPEALELNPVEAGTGSAKRRGSKAWLFGAYTFLFVWGMAFLVLYFTDRLPL